MTKIPLKRAVSAGLLALGAMLLFSAPAAAAARLTVESGGVSRSALVVLRDRLKLHRRPLIIVLRRDGGIHQRRHHGLEEAAESSKPIFVYPETESGSWPTAPGPAADRELLFLNDLTARVMKEAAVDPRKIYIVGVSSGGAFAYRAACAGFGHPLAGLATLISAMPDDLANCAPKAPVAYIAVSGAADPRIPFGGGPTTLPDASFSALPAETTLAAFAKAASCGARKEEKPIADRDPHDGSKAFILSYAGCKAPVELIRVDGGGHAIPGRKLEKQFEASGGQNNDFDAYRAIWDFLKRNGA